ncbi:MAG: BMP family ABC transporter substrate-binding protein [Chloroflexi bacterium]|nr:BMP family ABC transporter substrate-binding protein [Chloroflexota bacterium]
MTRALIAMLAVSVLIFSACASTGATPSAPAPSVSQAASEPAAESPSAAEPSVAAESPSEAAASPSEAASGDGASPSGEPSGSAPTTGGLAACGNQDSGDAFKIGGVTDVGQLEDKSFNEAGWCGTIAGATAVGGSAEVIVTEDPADYASNMQQLIDQDFDIIVTYGFALGNATSIAAKENPEVKFIGLDQGVCVDANGDPDPTFACEGDAAELLPNYQGLIFAEAQAGYLAGIVAAHLTESDVIGAVGGIDTIPPVVDYITGYENGAKSVNPDIEVLTTYVSDDITKAFNDPATGKSIGEQMIGQDADVLFQVAGLSGQGTLEAACDADIAGIGVDVDQSQSLPNLADCIATSAEKKIKDAISNAIQRVADGTDEAGTIMNDASADPPGVGLSPFGAAFADKITPEVQAMLDKALEDMKAGTLDPKAAP